MLLCNASERQMEWVFELYSRGVVEVDARKAMYLNCTAAIPDCAVVVAVAGSTVVALPF